MTDMGCSPLNEVVHRPAVTTQVSWKRPSLGLLKVNFDAAHSDAKGTGFGLVIRNEFGNLVVAACHKPPRQMNPTLADATCFKWPLQQCLFMGFSNVSFESDCITLTQDLEFNGWLAILFAYCMGRLQSAYTGVRIS